MTSGHGSELIEVEPGQFSRLTGGRLPSRVSGQQGDAHSVTEATGLRD